MVQTVSLHPEEYEIYASWKKGTRSRTVGNAIRMYQHLRRERRQRTREIVELESTIRNQKKMLAHQAKRIDALLCGLPDPEGVE